MKISDGIYCKNFILWTDLHTRFTIVEHNVELVCGANMCASQNGTRPLRWGRGDRFSTRLDLGLVKFSQVDLGSVCTAFARSVSTSTVYIPIPHSPRHYPHPSAVATCSHAQDLKTQWMAIRVSEYEYEYECEYSSRSPLDVCAAGYIVSMYDI